MRSHAAITDHKEDQRVVRGTGGGGGGVVDLRVDWHLDVEDGVRIVSVGLVELVMEDLEVELLA